MVKLKDCKMPKSCSECEFMGWFNAGLLRDDERMSFVTSSDLNEDEETVFGCTLTPTPKNMTYDPRYGVRLIKNIWKRPKWCRLKKSLF